MPKRNNRYFIPKDFDLLLKVCSEEFADTLESPSLKQAEDHFMGLYEDRIKQKMKWLKEGI